MAGSLLQKKTFCVVTGASRGLGRCIALTLGQKLPAPSCFLLMARDMPSMASLKTEILSANPELNVVLGFFDQADLKKCANKEIFIDVLKKIEKSVSDFEQALIIHNSGTAGDLTKFGSEFTDAGEVQTVVNVNVTGTILLNSMFFQTFQKEAIDCRTVVNISSLAALQPFPSWSLYCASKYKADLKKLLVCHAPNPTPTRPYPKNFIVFLRIFFFFFFFNFL